MIISSIPGKAPPTMKRILDVSIQTVKRYIVDGFYEAVVRRLYLQRSCTIPNLGTFTLVHEPESYQKQINDKGEEVIAWENSYERRFPEQDNDTVNKLSNFQRMINL